MTTPLLERVRLPPGLAGDLQRVLGQLQNNAEAALRRIFGKEVVDGVLVEGVALHSAVDATYVAHGLGREPKGFQVVDKDAAGDVWRAQVTNSRPTTHLALATDAPNLTVSLWVF